MTSARERLRKWRYKSCPTGDLLELEGSWVEKCQSAWEKEDNHWGGGRGGKLRGHHLD